LFFSEMRYDPRQPQNPDNDRFVLSKGHAAPVLYAAWAEVGLLKREDLLTLRRLDSDLEGHPTPRLAFVDVATGSLGQGICAAIGTALNARRISSEYRTYVLLGDGESAEGSVWEAAESAANDRLDSLCGITDVNGLGQSGPSIWNHDMEAYAAKWRAFGWHAIVVDGHDITALLDAYEQARHTKGKPTMILARTLKGKGIPLAEGKGGWHGKAFKKGAELEGVLKDLEAQLLPEDEPAPLPDGPRTRRDASRPAAAATKGSVGTPSYKMGDSVATREAYGTALAKLGDGDDRIVALDGDVKNSTFSEKFEEKHRDRFYQNFIAEQVMIGSAMGLAARGAIPFPSTFAAFLSRAYDFIRMACISNLNIKVAGSHAGVSIGEDGPSQMALEDLAMMRAAAEHDRALSVRRDEHRAAARADGVSSGSRLHAHVAAEDPCDLRSGREVRDRRAEDSARERERHRDGDWRRHHGGRGAQGLRPAAEDWHQHPRDRPLFAAADRLTFAAALRPRDQAHHHRRGSLRRRWYWRCGGSVCGGKRLRRRAVVRTRDSAQRHARTAHRSLWHLVSSHRRSGYKVGRVLSDPAEWAREQ
jgi:transketolase N-terminal domain/subunit